MPQAVTPRSTVPHPAATEFGCAWCDAPATALVARGRYRRRCVRCGVASTAPWPTESELAAAYGSWYRPATGRFGPVGDRILRASRSTLVRRITREAPLGPVLDIGAGDGTLTDAIRASGRDAIGLDRYTERPDFDRREPLEVDGEWAAIVLWHSLEHLPRAGAVIDHLATCLAPGGLIFVAMPNAGSIQARLFGDRWFALDVPRHLVHVPADALIARLQGAGLAVERIDQVRGGQIVFGWLHGIVGTLPGSPDLYDAIREPAARQRTMTGRERWGTLLAATALLPVALVAAAIEVALKRSGTAYVEARRPAAASGQSGASR